MVRSRKAVPDEAVRLEMVANIQVYMTSLLKVVGHGDGLAAEWSHSTDVLREYGVEVDKDDPSVIPPEAMLRFLKGTIAADNEAKLQYAVDIYKRHLAICADNTAYVTTFPTTFTALITAVREVRPNVERVWTRPDCAPQSLVHDELSFLRLTLSQMRLVYLG
ncbi:hypothetical protein ACHHYP_01426 [Achlya hypogyna]|uniref:Uncharacterized protein n=1 Tax=Achlya hypogyna TaxID=1202772 RepID=A0A1V9Z8M5_ACHHY|nr:hypothetical protein ACHHYP_01426 [Achlya hypogyna]